MTARIQGARSPAKLLPKSLGGEMAARVRRALWLVASLLSLSVLLVALGVYITTRTESLNVTGYISGIILMFGSFLGLLGLCLEENRKQLLTAAIVFLSFGIMAAFVCLLIDGVCVVSNMDMRPLRAERCQYYSGGSGYIYQNFYASVSCWSLKDSCTMTVRSGTCYCCDLYDCANGGFLSNYYEFVGVSSCEEVYTLYILLWILTALNLVALFTGILITAVLGSIKDLRKSSLETNSATTSPTAPRLDISAYFATDEKPAMSPDFLSSTSPPLPSPPPSSFPQTNLLPFRA